MKKICIFLAVVTALTSCVKDVILDAKDEPLLAVYCVLKNDPVQELKLSYTKSVTMDEAPRVTEATAVLTDLTEGSEADSFVHVPTVSAAGLFHNRLCAPCESPSPGTPLRKAKSSYSRLNICAQHAVFCQLWSYNSIDVHLFGNHLILPL